MVGSIAQTDQGTRPHHKAIVAANLGGTRLASVASAKKKGSRQETRCRTSRPEMTNAAALRARRSS